MKSPPVASFHTDDLGLAAFARCKGHTLERLEPSNGNGKRYRFVFDLRADEGDDLAKQYYSRDASVSAREFYEELGIFKRLLIQMKERAS